MAEEGRAMSMIWHNTRLLCVCLFMWRKWHICVGVIDPRKGCLGDWSLVEFLKDVKCLSDGEKALIRPDPVSTEWDFCFVVRKTKIISCQVDSEHSKEESCCSRHLHIYGSIQINPWSNLKTDHERDYVFLPSFFPSGFSCTLIFFFLCF